MKVVIPKSLREGVGDMWLWRLIFHIAIVGVIVDFLLRVPTKAELCFMFALCSFYFYRRLENLNLARTETDLEWRANYLKIAASDGLLAVGIFLYIWLRIVWIVTGVILDLLSS
jgi:hypothetical protein